MKTVPKLPDRRVVLQVETPKVRKPFSLQQRAFKNRKVYRRDNRPIAE